MMASSEPTSAGFAAGWFAGADVVACATRRVVGTARTGRARAVRANRASRCMMTWALGETNEERSRKDARGPSDGYPGPADLRATGLLGSLRVPPPLLMPTSSSILAATIPAPNE